MKAKRKKHPAAGFIKSLGLKNGEILRLNAETNVLDFLVDLKKRMDGQGPAGVVVKRPIKIKMQSVG